MRFVEPRTLKRSPGPRRVRGTQKKKRGPHKAGTRIFMTLKVYAPWVTTPSSHST